MCWRLFHGRHENHGSFADDCLTAQWFAVLVSRFQQTTNDGCFAFFLLRFVVGDDLVEHRHDALDRFLDRTATKTWQPFGQSEEGEDVDLVDMALIIRKP